MLLTSGYHMRRRLSSFMWMGTLSFVAAIHAVSAQVSPSKGTASQQPKAKSPAGSARAAGPPVTKAAPVQVDGEWLGTMSNGREIAFVIKRGVVILYRVQVGMPSQGCFIVPELNSETQVTWGDSSTYAPRVVGRLLNAVREFTDHSPGINARITYQLRGVFSSADSYVGAMTFTARSDRCEARSAVDLKAKRVPDGTLVRDMHRPPPPEPKAPPAPADVPPSVSAPANAPTASAAPAVRRASPMDGEWEGSVDGETRVLFSIRENAPADVRIEYVIRSAECLPRGEVRGQLTPRVWFGGGLEFNVLSAPIPSVATPIAFLSMSVHLRDPRSEPGLGWIRVELHESQQSVLGRRRYKTCAELINKRFPVQRVRE